MTQKKTKKHKQGAWFYRLRGSYLPCSWQGWLLYVTATLYILPPLAMDLATGESTVYVVTNFVTRLVLAGIVMTLVAQKKS